MYEKAGLPARRARAVAAATTRELFQSDSEPEDGAIATTIYEKAALPECNPDLPEDDWPQMELVDASVYMGCELVDLFDIIENGPFVVKGRLSKLKGQMKGLGKLPRLDSVCDPRN
jgi:hypothetical protein